MVEPHSIAKELAVAGCLCVSIGCSESRGVKGDCERGHGSFQDGREFLVHGGIVRAVRADRGVHCSHIELLTGDCTDRGAQRSISERSTQQELGIGFVSSDGALRSRFEISRAIGAVSWNILKTDDTVLPERSQNLLRRRA